MRSFERCKYLTKLMTSVKVNCKNEFSKQNFIYKYYQTKLPKQTCVIIKLNNLLTLQLIWLYTNGFVPKTDNFVTKGHETPDSGLT